MLKRDLVNWYYWYHTQLCLNPFLCCIYAYFSADDLWSQRAVIKWPESGSSRQSVSSSLFVHHSQTGSECRGLDSKEQQQARPFRPRRRVGIFHLLFRWKIPINQHVFSSGASVLSSWFSIFQGSGWRSADPAGSGPVRWSVEEAGWR